MVIGEFLAFHNVVEICSHEVCHQVPVNKRKRTGCEAIPATELGEAPLAGLTVPNERKHSS